MAAYLHIEPETVSFALKSLDSTISLDEIRNEDTNLYNSLSSKPLNLDELLDLKNTLSTLESPDKEIIILRYFNDYTQDELASMFNMSQVSISRILTRNLKKLKSSLS